MKGEAKKDVEKSERDKKNPLLPNKSMSFNHPVQLFTDKEIKKREQQEKCIEKAQKKCPISPLITQNQCYLQESNQPNSLITRNHQLLGTKHAYAQQTNNYMPKGKCDCSSRNFELCPKNEAVSEQCFHKEYKKCLHNFDPKDIRWDLVTCNG